MRGDYEANYLCSGVNSLRTLMYITAPAAKVVEILSASITNMSNTTNAQLGAQFQLVTTLGTPTSTAVTPTKAEQGDQASGSTVAANVTASEPALTANTAFGDRGFSSLGGWEFAPLPEERLYIAPGASWVLKLMDTAPAATDLEVRISYREIG